MAKWPKWKVRSTILARLSLNLPYRFNTIFISTYLLVPFIYNIQFFLYLSIQNLPKFYESTEDQAHSSLSSLPQPTGITSYYVLLWMHNIQCASLSGLHELPGFATNIIFLATPFVHTSIPLLMPVPVWEASTFSFSVKLHQLAELVALSSVLVIHSLCIYVFQHCCSVLTWNTLHFIPYKPVYFLKQLFHFTYSSAKNYAWYRTDVQYMFVEVNCSKALFSHLVAMWSRHVTFIVPASVI